MIRPVFLVGHALLPKGMAAKSIFDTLALTVEFEPKHCVILRADCTLSTEHGRDFVSRILVGHSLADGLEEVEAELSEVYLGAALPALSASIRDLKKEFQAWLERTGRVKATERARRRSLGHGERNA